ncbi:DNA helicase [Gracilaria domingensis]|nr:DNA helicase [Gracilaria domingensis]
MTVSEAETASSGVFATGGAAGIALTAGCTSFCFVSANLSGRSQVYSAFSSLNLGRQSFDVKNQFHHFTLAGQLGDMGWELSTTSHGSQSARQWSELKDGSFCYTLENRVSVLRNSFPTLRYEDRLHCAKDHGLSFRKSPALVLADGVVECRSRPINTVDLLENHPDFGLFFVSLRFEVVTIPDTRLIQWDCGKLQTLERLNRDLKARKSRALIFTQMKRMLDILESFLNLHCCRYLRLDGTTKTDDRQKVVERFNTDTRIFCMILTTRAGGVGLNLTGADTVIFYDSDYNPAIDNQAQDRAHRIGQTKPVHVYRLISEQTVEESILKRAMEKRALEQQVISQAGFTTDAIQRARGLLKADNSGSKNTVGDGFTLSGSAEKSGTVKNGFRSSSEPNHERKRHTTPENGKNGSISENGERPSPASDIQSSCGQFTGFGAGKAVEAVPHQGKLEGGSVECGSDRDMNEDNGPTGC